MQHPHLRVPMREASLSNGETVTLYDTSCLCTERDAEIDVQHGLSALRSDLKSPTGEEAPVVLGAGGWKRSAWIDSIEV